ncbi:hypothetical protein O3M35_010240 [Rhynocoris fuscipes]|uniref:Reverse transcriptase zinc-binding domain-containing protein n=1 Tax=Rhynocoris fuscipes TaxID=488301 RepID=A0AAW1CY54_9HEMI
MCSSSLFSIYIRCSCGERETAEHVIFECQLYDDLRVTLCRKIGFNINLNHASLPLLLENKKMCMRDSKSLPRRY